MPRVRSPSAPLHLVAIDGSAPSRRALDVAIRLAKGAGATLEVVTVEDFARTAGQIHDARQRPRVMAKVRASCDVLVERARQRAARAGVEARSRVIDSDEAGATIAAYADRRQADLVVVGSRGRGQVERLMLGSVAERVARMAPCTVVVVR